MPRARTAVPFALVAGAVTVGVVGQLAGAAPGVPHLATALGAPWLVAAFAAGGLLRRPVTGALGGAVLLAGGTLVYYLVRVALAPRLGIVDNAAIAVGWALAAAVAGAGMGVLGALWRRSARPSPLLAAVPAAALAGEALLLASEWRSRTAAVVLAAELLVAALVLLACARRRAALPAAALAACVLAAVFAVGESEVRGAMRAVGWNGA